MSSNDMRMRSQTMSPQRSKPLVPPRPSSMAATLDDLILLDDTVLVNHASLKADHDNLKVEKTSMEEHVPLENATKDDEKSNEKKDSNEKQDDVKTTQLVRPPRPPQPSTRPPQSATRPPPPGTRPPPPMTRPPRPYPPPVINEAALAKKRPPPTLPPPTPPLIIDSRDSPTFQPHAQRSLKNHNAVATPPATPPATSPVTPPPIANSPPLPIRENPSPTVTTSNSTSNATGSTINTTAGSGSTTATASTTGGTGNSEGITESMENSSSPRRPRLNKVKETFRSFSVRRSNDSRCNNSHNWRRMFTTRRPLRSDGDSPIENPMYPSKLPTGVVDPLLVQCVAYLNREEILKETGLFRIPGDLNQIKHLRSRYLLGEEIDLSPVLDPHVVTGLLKLYFREKPSPLLPRHCVNKLSASVRQNDVEAFQEVTSELNEATVASLRMLAELFKKIREYSDDNQMSSGVLATSCGPSFFPNMPPSGANALIKFLSDKCDIAFV